MDGFARLLHPVWQKILQNLGILINPDLKLTLSDLGSIRVPNPWRRHELGIYVTSTKEVQRYVVIIHFGSIDRSFYLNTWHFHVVITPRVSMIQIEDRNRIIDLVNWLNCLAHLSLYFLDVVRFYNFSFLKMNVIFHDSNFTLVVSIVLIILWRELEWLYFERFVIFLLKFNEAELKRGTGINK